jgi:hypothetical protein
MKTRKLVGLIKRRTIVETDPIGNGKDRMSVLAPFGRRCVRRNNGTISQSLLPRSTKYFWNAWCLPFFLTTAFHSSSWLFFHLSMLYGPTLCVRLDDGDDDATSRAVTLDCQQLLFYAALLFQQPDSPTATASPRRI